MVRSRNLPLETNSDAAMPSNRKMIPLFLAFQQPCNGYLLLSVIINRSLYPDQKKNGDVPTSRLCPTPVRCDHRQRKEICVIRMALPEQVSLQELLWNRLLASKIF